MVILLGNAIAFYLILLTLHLIIGQPLVSNLIWYDALQEAYENAKDLAMGDTDLPEQTFPPACPYPLNEILSDRFYPGEPSELV